MMGLTVRHAVNIAHGKPLPLKGKVPVPVAPGNVHAAEQTCIDEKWPADICHHSIVLQRIIHSPAKLEQMLHMPSQLLLNQISLQACEPVFQCDDRGKADKQKYNTMLYARTM